MNRLEELLMRWQDDSLSAEEIVELRRMLEDQDARRQLVEEFHFVETVSEVMRSEQLAREPVSGRRMTWGRVIKFVVAPLAAAAAVLLCLFGMHVNRMKQMDVDLAGRVLEVRGSVEHRSGDKVARSQISSFKSQASSVQPGDTIRIGDSVETGPDGYLKYSYTDGSLVEVERNTRMALGADMQRRAKRIKLEAGILAAEIVKQGEGRIMAMETSIANANLVGTRFRLCAWADSTRLRVDDGKVRLERKSDGKYVDVPAGSSAIAKADFFLSTPPLPRRVTKGLLALYTFMEGTGATIYDVSGVGEPLDLAISDMKAVGWIKGGGLSIKKPVMIKSLTSVARIAEVVNASQEISIESWERKSRPEQMDLVYFMGGEGNMDEVFGTSSNENLPVGRNHHQVYTVQSFYIDGVSYKPRGSPVVKDGKAQTNRFIPGGKRYMSPGLRLVLGNTGSDNVKPFRGEFFLAAIYGRQLTAEEAKRNFDSGAPGMVLNSKSGKPPTNK